MQFGDTEDAHNVKKNGIMEDKVKQQAETDKFVTDFYLGTNERKKISV